MVTNQYPMKKPEGFSARTHHKSKYLVFFYRILSEKLYSHICKLYPVSDGLLMSPEQF
jgi:hypothetical protein